MLSFRKARIAYDGTVCFCRRFLDKRDRTVDQMVQAAPIVANILVCLIHQTNYLLDRQLRALEKAFVEEGGLRERMTRARLRSRRR